MGVLKTHTHIDAAHTQPTITNINRGLRTRVVQSEGSVCGCMQLWPVRFVCCPPTFASLLHPTCTIHQARAQSWHACMAHRTVQLRPLVPTLATAPLLRSRTQPMEGTADMHAARSWSSFLENNPLRPLQASSSVAALSALIITHMDCGIMMYVACCNYLHAVQTAARQLPLDLQLWLRLQYCVPCDVIATIALPIVLPTSSRAQPGRGNHRNFTLYPLIMQELGRRGEYLPAWHAGAASAAAGGVACAVS
jgi:hypothetical protein